MKPKYLYHGSKHKVDVLLPHQAFGLPEENGAEFGIYAYETMEAVLPFTLSVLPLSNGNLSWNVDDETNDVIISAGLFDEKAKGYIYKLPSDSFEKLDEKQYVSKTSVVPLEIIEVDAKDFLHKVTLVDSAKEIKDIADIIAPCGLVCKQCDLEKSCGGCRQCDTVPCDKDIFSGSHKSRDYITYIKANGKEKLAEKLYYDAKKGKISKLKSRGLSAYELKWAAIITMLIDHVYKVFGIFWMPAIGNALQIDPQGSYYLILVLFGIGSMTMNIFAWFIAEGCRYTHNIKAYIGRLLLFGLLSEIPFQLMIKAIMREPLTLQFGLTNIMFTFALGAISCYGYQLLRDKGRNILSLCAPVVCAAAAYFLHTDYDVFGVIAIFLCYIIKNKKKRLAGLAALTILFRGLIYPIIDILDNGFSSAMVLTNILISAYALVSIAFLYFYNGERGKKSKYFFYAFYPLHMLIIAAVYAFIS